MVMHLKIEPRSDHLHAAVSGSFTHAQLADLLKEIFAASTQHGLRKILLDIGSLEGDIPLMARYDFGRMAAELQREPVRFVVVGSKDQMWPDRFGENVANNRGIAAKVTTNMEEALTWLRGDA